MSDATGKHRLFCFTDRLTGDFSKIDGSRTVEIEAPDEGEAIEMFMHQFGINPRRVSCECCGQDFEVIELATGQGGS